MVPGGSIDRVRSPNIRQNSVWLFALLYWVTCTWLNVEEKLCLCCASTRLSFSGKNVEIWLRKQKCWKEIGRAERSKEWTIFAGDIPSFFSAGKLMRLFLLYNSVCHLCLSPAHCDCASNDSTTILQLFRTYSEVFQEFLSIYRLLIHPVYLTVIICKICCGKPSLAIGTGWLESRTRWLK